MPHWWNETITIYRKQKTKGADGKTSVDWNREVLSGCFVGHTRQQTFDGNAIRSTDSWIVRIPAMYAAPQKGDIIMAGERLEDVPDKSSDEAMIVDVVHDNTKLRQPHWYGGGQR